MVYVIRLHGRRCGNVHGYPYEYKTYTRFLVRCARTRDTLTRGRLTDHLPGSRARKTKQVPMFFPARRRVSYSRFSAARDFPLASFEKKSRFDPRRGVSRRLTIARQTTHSPRDRACDRLSWIHEATFSTKPRPILYTRYCVQVIYRLELGKGKGGYFYLYFSPRLNARLNEEDNFLKFSAVYDPCFTIVFEIRGRLIKTRYFTVELIAGGGGGGRGNDKRLRFSDASFVVVKINGAIRRDFEISRKFRRFPTTSFYYRE